MINPPNADLLPLRQQIAKDAGEKSKQILSTCRSRANEPGSVSA